MEVGLIYSSKDPDQLKARDFVKQFIAERGILVKYVESDQPVKSPKVVVNGLAIYEKRKKPRGDNPSMFPDIKTIAKVLDYNTWCL